MLLELTVELVLLLDGSCCRSWRGESWRRERVLKPVLVLLENRNIIMILLLQLILVHI
ncbi:hypothetical protein OIU78_001244 [Salix suchowensis]|nr:hypothetical protein OIU78_001244 [Salix suchowensis]